MLCRDKVKFPTRKAAKARLRKGPAGNHGLHAYLCQECGWIHLGHKDKKPPVIDGLPAGGKMEP